MQIMNKIRKQKRAMEIQNRNKSEIKKIFYKQQENLFFFYQNCLRTTRMNIYICNEDRMQINF